MFQSQGRFFGGCCASCLALIPELKVSIAGAILWGVLPTNGRDRMLFKMPVSIAGAILWGVLPLSG